MCIVMRWKLSIRKLYPVGHRWPNTVGNNFGPDKGNHQKLVIPHKESTAHRKLKSIFW